MAYTQTDLDNIKKAIATGALRVAIGGRDTIFRSLEDMQQIENRIASEVDQIANPTTYKSTRIVRPIFP